MLGSQGAGGKSDVLPFTNVFKVENKGSNTSSYKT